jgi:hypothetical protein
MSTLLLSLGGAAYPNAGLLRHEAFAASSRAISALLTTSDAPLVRREDHLDLLDDPRSWPDQLMAVRAWLRARIPEGPQVVDVDGVENVLVHYVGHGMFRPNSEEHYLSINATDGDDRAMTSASLGQLNEILTKNAPRQRRIYLIDACFAAASLRDIMSAPGNALEEKVGAIISPWPESGQGETGVAALCSADRISTASAGGERRLTQFTDGLLSVLEAGDPSACEGLSLRRTHQLLRAVLSERYGEDAVRPVLVAPEDRDGGIAAVPLFPNVGERTRTKAEAASARGGSETVGDAVTMPLGGGEACHIAKSRGAADHLFERSSLVAEPVAVTEAAATNTNGSVAGPFDWNSETNDGLASGMEVNLTPDQRFRQATYRFFRLPHSQKDAIASKLDVDHAGDAALSDLDRYKAVLARARAANRVNRLESMINKAEGQ